MNAPIRTALVATIVGLLAVCVFGLRFGCSPSAFQKEIRRGENLERLKQATFRRVEARRQAVQEWIAQRYSLAETMQRFQEWEREWPDYSAIVRKTQTESDEKRYYRIIGSHVEAVLQGRPEELASALCRLEKDYQQLQAGGQTPSTASSGDR